MCSKSVTFIEYNNSFQYSTVFVLSSIALRKMWLCRVLSWRAIFPIMFSVFRLFNYDNFFIPNSISVASLFPYIGDLKIALIALLLDMLYLSWIALSLFIGVFISPYYTCAYIAPTIRFLLIAGVTPPPLNMNGTSCAFVFSALVSYLFRCSLCYRSYSIIFPRYLYFVVRSISFPW